MFNILDTNTTHGIFGTISVTDIPEYTKMLQYWKWALNVKVMSWVLGLKVGREGSLTPYRFLPLRVTFWSFIYTFAFCSFLLNVSTVHEDSCHVAIMNETFQVYNVTLVVATYGAIGFATNMFCVIRITFRDLSKIINKSINLHKRFTYALGQHDEKSFYKMKFLILFTYLMPFIMAFCISFDCARYVIRNCIHFIV